MRLLCFITIFFFSIVALAYDIPTANTGEQSMIKSLREAIDKNPLLKERIVLGAGLSGCEAFQEKLALGQTPVLLIWQWLDAMQNISGRTIVVVPEHALDHRFKALNPNIRLIIIPGVLHTKSLQSLQAESTRAINPMTEYIVMMAGDTQQENGQWVLYTKDMLQEFLKTLPKNKKLLILSSPRTGKHKLQKGSLVVDESAHKTTTDPLTQVAMDMSKSLSSWQVVDFKYTSKSLWLQALKFCTDHSHVGLILPGESTSMIAESISLGIIPIIYSHPAMTPTSRRYIASLKKRQKIFLHPAWGLKHYRQEIGPDPRDHVVRYLETILCAS